MNLLQQLKYVSQEMGAGDKVAASLLVMIIGMVLVFLVLLAVYGVVVLMNRILKRSLSGKAASAPVTPSQPAMLSDLPAETATAGPVADQNLVAVITAAICASLQVSPHRLVVRKIVAADSQAAWSQAALREQNHRQTFH